jgi:two-component system LytT family response regulator
MTTTALIIDDEASARETLHGLLRERHPNVSVIGMATNVPEGIELVRQTRPDIIFLDVEMGPMTGFDLLKALPPEGLRSARSGPHVIFSTAHESYALRAIRFNALDYLLKPIVPEELDEAVHKVTAMLAGGQSGGDVPALLGSVVSDRQIALPVNDGLAVLHLDDILYCSSDDNYTEVYVRGEKKPHIISRPLSSFDRFLAPQGFVRIHQSHLVNRKQIKRYVKGEGGEVVMADGRNLPVSRRQKADLMEALEKL